jgi:Spy/CpxP family protein refolding chaperone
MGLGLERLRELDLSAEQKTKLQEIGERFMRSAIQKQADIRLAMLDLRKAVRDEKPDKMKFDAAVDKLARLRVDLAKSCFGARLEARAVLTPEQIKKWREAAMGEGEEEEEGD